MDSGAILERVGRIDAALAAATGRADTLTPPDGTVRNTGPPTIRAA